MAASANLVFVWTISFYQPSTASELCLWRALTCARFWPIRLCLLDFRREIEPILRDLEIVHTGSFVFGLVGHPLRCFRKQLEFGHSRVGFVILVCHAMPQKVRDDRSQNRGRLTRRISMVCRLYHIDGSASYGK